MAKRPRKRKAAARPKGPQPFHRAPRLPQRMQGSADLWLDMYMEFASRLIDDTITLPNALIKLDTSKALADRALEIFENRWPGAEL